MLLVVAAHMAAGAFPSNRGLSLGRLAPRGGGVVGVQLFFVLSGYLITSILLAEKRRTGTISLAGFYRRRARRLGPALLVLVAGYLVAIAITNPGRLHAATWAALLAVTYTTNVARVLGSPSSGWLDHTWSLAVEEQFYVVWGIAMWLLRPRWIGRVAVAGVVLTIAGRCLLHPSGEAIYDLWRWDAPLAGALLACWHPRFPRWMGVPALACLTVFLFHPVSTSSSAMYAITTACCVVLIDIAPRIALLRSRELVWSGTISYGLYLWHSMILHIGWASVPSTMIAVAFAATSWYAIERPILRQGRHSGVNVERDERAVAEASAAADDGTPDLRSQVLVGGERDLG